MELPLWPPLVALALGAASLLWSRREARKFDERFPPREGETR